MLNLRDPGDFTLLHFLIARKMSLHCSSLSRRVTTSLIANTRNLEQMSRNSRLGSCSRPEEVSLVTIACVVPLRKLHCTFFNGSNSTRQRSHTSSMFQGGVFQGRNTRTRSRNGIKTSGSTIWEEEDPKYFLINTASRLSEEMARSQKASYLATTLTLNL